MPNNTKVDWNKVIFKGLFLKGIYGREMFNTWYKMDAFIEKGLDITPVITGNYHYSEYEKAFEKMISGNAGKLILGVGLTVKQNGDAVL